MKRITLIDFIKGFSITTIVIFHLLLLFGKDLPDIIQKAISFGGTGVHAFVFCSGFGLYLSQLNKPMRYFSFLKKRLFKIYIPYIIIVLISFCIPLMYTNADRIFALLSHVFLFKMFDSSLTNSFGLHFWFVSMIIQFYLIFPILSKILSKIGDKKFIILGVVVSLLWATVVAILGKSELRAWNSFFLQYLWEFCLGMVLAKKYFDTKELNIPTNKKLVILTLGGLFIYSAMAFSGNTLKLYNDIPALIGYLSLAILIYNLNIQFLNNIILKISNISYELYLIHILVFKILLVTLSSTIPIVLLAIIALLVTYISSLLYHKLLIKLKLI